MALGVVVDLPQRYDHRDAVGFRPRETAMPTHSHNRPWTASMDGLTSRQGKSDHDCDGSSKPRLPSLSNLLAGAVHHDMLPHSKPRISDSYKPEHDVRSLPTPPATGTWSAYDEQRQNGVFGSFSHFDQQPLPPSHQHHHRLPQPAEPGRSIDSHPGSRNGLPLLPSMDLGLRSLPAVPATTSNASNLNIRPTGRVMKEEIIPGKGLCFVYEDGSVCPKSVNGDAVNPIWGTTKTGKPRKRLGQACNTCREKKIKCDPSYPKCTQCQKFGRECRFEATSRSGHRSPRARTVATSPASSHKSDELGFRRSSATPTEISESGDAVQFGDAKSPMTVDNLLSPVVDTPVSIESAVSPKRARLSEPDSRVFYHRQVSPEDESVTPCQDSAGLGFSWEVDPFHVNPKLTEYYMSAYYEHVDVATFGIFPREPFRAWATNGERKSSSDRMVLHAMMALATVFVTHPDRMKHRQMFAGLAHQALIRSHGRLSLPTVQTRFFLCMAEYSSGDRDLAYDLLGGAMRTACGLHLNTEEGIATAEPPLYGLDRESYKECKRRSFWAIYITERFGAFCLGDATSINKEDVFLRLPCCPELYNRGRVPDTPTFDGKWAASRSTAPREHSQLGAMAYLAQIATLCYEVHAIAFRTRHRTSSGRHQGASEERQELERQLQIWEQGYRSSLGPSSCTHPASKPGLHSKKTPNRSAGLHVLYHFALMELNRHVEHAHLSRQEVHDHAAKAHSHAFKILEIVQQLVSRGNTGIRDYSFATKSPLTANAVFSAIDVITAAGMTADLLEHQSRTLQLVYRGIEMLDCLAEHWASARFQRELVSERMRTVSSIVSASVADRKVAFFVCEPMPLSISLGPEFDLVYGLDRLEYLRALGWGNHIRNPQDLVEIRVKRDSCGA